MISIDDQVSRAESKLERLSDGFRELSSYGADAEEIAESLSFRDVNRQALFDIGQIVLLRSVRLKLEVFKLMADLADMELIEQAEATVDEVEQFYADLEREWQEKRRGSRPQLMDYISPLPSEPESTNFFDLSGVEDSRLFSTIQGFFDEPGEVGVEIPQELLSLTQTIDMEGLQNEIQARIEPGVTVRDLSAEFSFGNRNRTLGLVFSACLFLDIAGAVWLVQGGEDVNVLPVVD